MLVAADIIAPLRWTLRILGEQIGKARDIELENKMQLT